MARIGKTREPQGRGSIRCAIYTRKSTEDGLDQAFNSLDAQREACAAYVLSQQHEGWTLLPDQYDDGGYSGGTLERPGLKRLLADVRAGKVDVILVYKVDRLTRALSGFAKIIDVLDEADASFVSITQAFNTTTSMGRLTLNVLLSFAQFEREVISERVRDKIAASRKKGMWMGGTVPFGYEVRDRKLVVVPDEAGTVRYIYRRYTELGSVRALLTDLAAKGVVTKVRSCRDGSAAGGNSFSGGPLYYLLSNRLYLGEVRHRGNHYPGEHDAIVDLALWMAVQERLAKNRVVRRSGCNDAHPSLLAGMIRDTVQGRLASSHSNKAGRRYRYYITRPAGHQLPIRLAAADIERATVQSLLAFLRDTNAVVSALPDDFPSDQEPVLLASLFEQAHRIEQATPTARRPLLEGLALEILIEGPSVIGWVSPWGSESEMRLSFPLPLMFRRTAQERRIVYTSPLGAESSDTAAMIELLAKARVLCDGLISGALIPDPTSNGSDGRRYIARIARLAYLAPDIVEALVAGRCQPGMTPRRLVRHTIIPLCWKEQRRLFGISAPR